VQRIVQEALTNVRKHAPGAAVSVTVHAGELPGEDVVLRVDDRPVGNGRPRRPKSLAASGGGYGLRGMRERAQLLGGTLDAGAGPDGWGVELRLPPPGAGTPSTPATPSASSTPSTSTTALDEATP
jgi:signal transduction histidine kinase